MKIKIPKNSVGMSDNNNLVHNNIPSDANTDDDGDGDEIILFRVIIKTKIGMQFLA